MQEKSEISPQMITAWIVLCESPTWLTNNEIAEKAKISQRTARMYTKYLFDLMLLEKLEAYPGHKFKICDNADRRNPSAFARLETHKKAYLQNFEIA